MVLVCEFCQTPIYTEYYVAEREPAKDNLGHKTRFYHLQCWIQRKEMMKI